MNADFRRALLSHYDRHARDLPWRRRSDPYGVLVSEVMLQQTRVETVIGYYERWMERFPHLDALASASEDDVLDAWEGLGYYRRARNLHATARVVRERHGGILPDDAEGLRALPGIGEYTAGAVASIAFGQAEPAVDGNVRRVLSRLSDRAEPTPVWLRETARAWQEPSRPGDWNQALMELGATVCTPRSPRCDVCPVGAWCDARREGTVEQRPGPTVRRAPRTAHLAVAVFRVDGLVLLTRRPPEGLLAGLWAFPEEELPAPPDSGAPRAVLEGLAERAGLRPAGPIEALPPLKHRFTHIDATYWAYLVDVDEAVQSDGSAWVGPVDSRSLALPRAQRRILEGVT